MMEEVRKNDYSKIARKANKLLKEGMGLIEIINSANRSINMLNDLERYINKKGN